MNLVIKEIKEEMKQRALDIHNVKVERNEAYRSGNKGWEVQYKLNNLQYEFRHRHIARCELRGKTREQIETPSENHPANEKYITKIKEEWTRRYEEALCANAA